MPFTLAAPDTLVGLPRTGRPPVSDGAPALVTYGQGLGAIAVIERKADAGGRAGGTLAGLPTVSIDGATGHELATALGTVIESQQGGVSYTLAGSLPPAAAEAAARGLT